MATQTRMTHRAQFVLRLVLTVLVMMVIFIVDTVMHLEVAVAVFYTVVILTASRALNHRQLSWLCMLCMVMTVVSFALTGHGVYKTGLINMAISLAAIVITTYLVLKMEAARTAADQAQEQLTRMARAKSLEGLTTSIAHEVNQPLAAIVTSGNACQRWLAQDPPNYDRARQALERILNDAGRASSIIARVRSLTKGEPPQKNAFDLNRVVLEIIDLSQAEISHNHIHLEMRLQPDLPEAWGDSIQIQQVVANLVLNAIEAMQPDSRRTRMMRVSSKLEGDCIVISVMDSGAGVAHEVKAHLFDAFWTTKDQGVGVGLSISRAIVEANGGQIQVSDNPHGGALFQFSVPVANKEHE